MNDLDQAANCGTLIRQAKARRTRAVADLQHRAFNLFRGKKAALAAQA